MRRTSSPAPARERRQRRHRRHWAICRRLCYTEDRDQDSTEEASMNLSNRAKRGITLAVAVFAGLAFRWLAVLFLLLAAALIAWGQQPQRTEEFLGRLPFGDFLLRALAQLDMILSARD